MISMVNIFFLVFLYLLKKDVKYVFLILNIYQLRSIEVSAQKY